MGDPDKHEDRAQGGKPPLTDEQRRDLIAQHYDRAAKAADQLRAMLLVLAPAGIAAAFTARDVIGRGWKLAGALFIAALFPLVVSWFLVKHRALRRAKDLLGGKPEREYKWWDLRASTPWDMAGAILTGLGALAVAISAYLCAP